MSPRRARAVIDRGGEPAAELREHLIVAAERLLGEGEPATVTTRDIARTAGVSDGVLYNHFANKDDLMLTALVRRYGRLLERYRAAVEGARADPVEEGLLAQARAAFDLHAEALPIVAALLGQPPLLRRFLEEIHRSPLGVGAIRGPVVDQLVNGQADGRIHVGDPVAAADLLLGAAMLLALTSSVGGLSPEDLESRLRSVVGTLIQGLRPAEAP